LNAILNDFSGCIYAIARRDITSTIKRSTETLAGCYFKTEKLYHKTMLEKKPRLGGSFFNGLVGFCFKMVQLLTIVNYEPT